MDKKDKTKMKKILLAICLLPKLLNAYEAPNPHADFINFLERHIEKKLMESHILQYDIAEHMDDQAYYFMLGRQMAFLEVLNLIDKSNDLIDSL